tara:strand:+ start:1513 stop:1728 length:216 start_codon:yes stop_codon:yes gene_type:complete
MIKNAEEALVQAKGEAEEVLECVEITMPVDNYLRIQDAGHLLKSVAEQLEKSSEMLLDIGSQLEYKDRIDG